MQAICNTHVTGTCRCTCTCPCRCTCTCTCTCVRVGAESARRRCSAPEYSCQQPRVPSLPFSPPSRARLARWRVMAGGVWARARGGVCAGGGRDTCIRRSRGGACSCSTSRASLVCQFGNVGAHNAATPRDRPSCLGAPVRYMYTGPVSVQLGAGLMRHALPPHHGRAGRSRRLLASMRAATNQEAQGVKRSVDSFLQ
eukprot:COSAG01_NODE_10571_length_2129_cov_4.778376_1_plen_197_part_10